MLGKLRGISIDAPKPPYFDKEVFVMIADSIKTYKFSIILFLVLSFFLLLSYGFRIFSETADFLYHVNYLLYILSGLVGFVGASSFALPYASYIYFRRRRVDFKNVLSGIMDFVYMDIIGLKSEKFLLKKLGIKDREMFNIIRTADMCSIILIILFMLFFVKDKLFNFFLLMLILESSYVIFRLIHHKREIEKESGRFLVYVLSCASRYLLEFPKVILTFYAVGLFLGMPAMFLFLVSSSFLYFLPKFKSAGGLLELYTMIFFVILGRTAIEGFIVAVLFRISGIIFHILPVYIYKR